MTQLTLAIDPRLTFLQTGATDTRAGSAVAIDLEAAGFHVGDSLLFERLGAFAPHGTGAADDIATGMIGVFSSSNELLDASYAQRVVGAIDAGTDWVSSIFNGGSNDIAQDFTIYRSTIIVPLGARYLYVAAGDSYWGDNTDPNGDFAVRITAVPEPGQWALFAAGLALMGATRWRQRRTATARA